MNKTFCDCCGCELSKPTGYHDYVLHLNCAPTPVDSHVFLKYIPPPLSHPHTFCDLNCLKIWLETRERKEKDND